jgi:hypothetical protein
VHLRHGALKQRGLALRARGEQRLFSGRQADGHVVRRNRLLIPLQVEERQRCDQENARIRSCACLARVSQVRGPAGSAERRQRHRFGGFAASQLRGSPLPASATLCRKRVRPKARGGGELQTNGHFHVHCATIAQDDIGNQSKTFSCLG